MEEPDGYQVVTSIPAPSLPYNQPGTCYTLVEITDPDAGIITAGPYIMSCTIASYLQSLVLSLIH